jgi:hypothetical protein
MLYICYLHVWTRIPYLIHSRHCLPNTDSNNSPFATMPTSSFYFLTLIATTASAYASPVANVAARQENTPFTTLIAAPTPQQTEPADCNPLTGRVTSCTTEDFTQAKWRTFDIDTYLETYIDVFGLTPQFPKTFVQNQLDANLGAVEFDCRSIDSQSCSQPTSTLAFGGDRGCAFRFLDDLGVCGSYIAPEAAFIAENYVRLFQGARTSRDAINDAAAAIKASTFINDVVDSLAEERGSIGAAILESIAGIALGFLPFAEAISAAGQLASGLDSILGESGEAGISLPDSTAIITTVVSNEQIEDEKERLKDQISRQLDEIARAYSSRMDNVLFAVFEAEPVNNGVGARDSTAFKMVADGRFMEAVPSREELARDTEAKLKHWILTSALRSQNWVLLLDPTQLLDVPGAGVDIGTSCRGNQGVSHTPISTLNNPC